MRAIFGISGLVIVFFGFIVIRNSIIPSCIGAKDGRLAPLPTYLHAVSSQTEIAQSRVEPFQFKNDFTQTKDSILKALEKFTSIEVVKNEGPYIHALSRSGIFGSAADIEFYLDEKDGLVHYRSAPRLYTFDSNSCRDRYEQIASLY